MNDVNINTLFTYFYFLFNLKYIGKDMKFRSSSANKYYQTHASYHYEEENEEEEEEEEEEDILEFKYYFPQIDHRKYASADFFHHLNLEANKLEKKRFNSIIIIINSRKLKKYLLDIQEMKIWKILLDTNKSTDSNNMSRQKAKNQRKVTQIGSKDSNKAVYTEGYPSNVYFSDHLDSPLEREFKSAQEEKLEINTDKVESSPIPFHYESDNLHKESDIQHSFYDSEEKYKNVSFGRDINKKEENSK